MRVAIYARVSGRSQALKGTSITEQVRACRQWARDHKYRVVAVYKDPGVSGRLLDRPELGRAMIDAKAKKFDALVVLDLDRLARDLVVQETIIGELDRADVGMRSLNQPNLDGDDPSRRFARQMFGAVAEYQRAMIVWRLALGREAVRRAGGYAEGHPRYGYRARRGGGLEPDPDEQRGVALIRRLRRQTPPASWRAIAAELERAGIKPRKGGTWHPNTVRRIHAYGNKPFARSSTKLERTA